MLSDVYVYMSHPRSTVRGANIRRIEAQLGEDEAKRGLNGDKNVVGAQNGVRSSRHRSEGDGESYCRWISLCSLLKLA